MVVWQDALFNILIGCQIINSPSTTSSLQEHVKAGRKISLPLSESHLIEIALVAVSRMMH